MESLYIRQKTIPAPETRPRNFTGAPAQQHGIRILNGSERQYITTELDSLGYKIGRISTAIQLWEESASRHGRCGAVCCITVSSEACVSSSF